MFETFKLNPHNMLPEVLLRNISSFHWVDRFSSAGEFTIISPDISWYMKNISVGDYLGVTLDYSMMIVENITIRNGYDKRPEITITGRTAETFLEGRFLVGKDTNPLDLDQYVIKNKHVPDLMYTLVREGGSRGGIGLSYPFVQGPNDVVGSKIVEYEVSRQSVYQAVSDLAQSYAVSFHVRRPKDSDQARQVRLICAPGDIKTESQRGMFSSLRGDMLNESYVSDIQDVVHSVHTYTKLKRGRYDRGNKGNYIHRAKLVDLPDSEPKESIVRAKAEGSRTVTDTLENSDWYVAGFPELELLRLSLVSIGRFFENKYENRYAGEIEVYQQRAADEKARLYYQMAQQNTRYSFEPSPTCKALYGKDYQLGDIVSVHPSWGNMIEMRVDSYVYSMDESGFKSYPELVNYNPIENKLEHWNPGIIDKRRW